jgi:hypothetical protein
MGARKERAKRSVEEHMALHSDVVNKTDLIITYIRCMDIYSLWWMEQQSSQVCSDRCEEGESSRC